MQKTKKYAKDLRRGDRINGYADCQLTVTWSERMHLTMKTKVSFSDGLTEILDSHYVFEEVLTD